MGTMDESSPLTAAKPLSVLPPAPARGTNAPPVSQEDFRAMLATQGVKAPAGAVPTTAEAQIEAAQIAAKAHVKMGVTRDPVLSGKQPQPATAVVPTEGRFMPLREGKSAARTFSAPSNTAINTLPGLRATTKFAPGPSTMATTAKAAPRPAEHAAEPAANPASPAQPAAPSVPPNAVEAYSYGLRAASQTKPGDVPSWFGDAMQQGLEKYDALNKANKKP
jgi:hypothetical protein